MNDVSVCAELSLAAVGGKQHDALIAFADDCAARVARDVPGIERWDLFVVAGIDGQAMAMVRARMGDTTVEVRANACDPAQAIWSAMRQVEEPLRTAALARPYEAQPIVRSSRS